ncbi:MAG: cation:proton antiporter [Bacteroidales bacterium]|nr:cation:proton antiporter [Bacteroidales bacterium]
MHNSLSLPFSDPVIVFTLVLIILLIIPFMLRKVNVPGIVGLISAGVLIGPSGLGLLENNSAIELFSTIGLLYIMFLAGLELDLNQFKNSKNKSIVFGLLTFTIPLLLGFPVCYYILGYDFNASFLTSSIFSTHTLIAYPIISRLGLSKSLPVAVAVGGTILTDTLVLVILAINIGLAKGDLNGLFWIKLSISIVLLSILAFFIFPRISRWFFRNFESEKIRILFMPLPWFLSLPFLRNLQGWNL